MKVDQNQVELIQDDIPQYLTYLKHPHLQVFVHKQLILMVQRKYDIDFLILKMNKIENKVIYFYFKK